MSEIRSLALEQANNNIQSTITEISIAFLVLFIGLILGKLSGLIIRKLFYEFQADKALSKLTPLKINLTRVLSVGVSYFFYIATIIYFFYLLGILNFLASVVLAIIILVILTTLFFYFRDFYPNYAAGKEFKKKYSIGKMYKDKTVKGEILKLNKVEFLVKCGEDIIHIPYIHTKKKL